LTSVVSTTQWWSYKTDYIREGDRKEREADQLHWQIFELELRDINDDRLYSRKLDLLRLTWESEEERKGKHVKQDRILDVLEKAKYIQAMAQRADVKKKFEFFIAELETAYLECEVD